MSAKLCAFDVETTGKVPEFKIGALYSDYTSGVYEDAGEMIEVMRTHARKGYTFIAHNAEYDIAVLLWGRSEDVTISYTNNQFSTAAWQYSTGRRTSTIWDSMRLSAGLSLAEIGEAIGLPKYSTPLSLIDPNDWRRDWVCYEHGMPGCQHCYVLRDAEIVWCYCNALREWLDAYGLHIYHSLPKTAIDLWRLFDDGQQQTIRSPGLQQLGRRALHGGRCEVIQYGHVGRVYTGDFRSFYGSILRDIAVPDVRQLRLIERPTSNALDDGTDGIVSAYVDIYPQHVPPLPVAYHGRSYYPVGSVYGAWPISELRTALSYGVTIRKIESIAYSDRLVRPFHSTASTLLELRESLRNKKDARELVAKFILNAIPGRLGVREVSERVTYRRWRADIRSEQLKGYELESAGRDLYLARRSQLRRPSRSSNVMWAAIINAAGRLRLNDKLRYAGDDLLYCDTDSVHSLAPLPIDGELPGMFRDTGVYDTGLYLGSKFYSLETDDGKSETRAKGIPRNLAVDFIKNRHVAYQTSFGVVNGILRGVKPCVWVDVDRVARMAPGTRTILEPAVLSGDASRSTTTPVVFGTVDGVLTADVQGGMIDSWKD